MSISAEELAPNIYILRIHEDGGGYGDAFNLACIAIISGQLATIKSLVSAPGAANRENYIKITEWLKSRGATYVEWERYKDGKNIPIKFTLK